MVKMQDFIKMQYPVLLHFFLFALAVGIGLILPSINSLQVAALAAVESTRTLLALNGTLLALVVGFSAFYFAVLDNRRLDAVSRMKENGNSYRYIEWGFSKSLVKSYREKMRTASTLLISIAFSYSFFLLISFTIYMSSLPITNGNVTGLAIYGFSVSAASPVVTVGSAIIMTWFLTRDVAGRSPQKHLRW